MKKKMRKPQKIDNADLVRERGCDPMDTFMTSFTLAGDPLMPDSVTAANTIDLTRSPASDTEAKTLEMAINALFKRARASDHSLGDQKPDFISILSPDGVILIAQTGEMGKHSPALFLQQLAVQKIGPELLPFMFEKIFASLKESEDEESVEQYLKGELRPAAITSNDGQAEAIIRSLAAMMPDAIKPFGEITTGGCGFGREDGPTGNGEDVDPESEKILKSLGITAVGKGKGGGSEDN